MLTRRPHNDGRLLVTPHTAWSCPEALTRAAVETAMLFLREGRPRNVVNARSSEAEHPGLIAPFKAEAQFA